MKLKKVLIGGVAASMLLTGGLVAQASTKYKSYSTTVGPINGSGYSSYQTKNVAGQKADISHKSNGGYSVDVRTNSSGSNGTWARNLQAGDKRQLSNSHNKGTQTRLQFSNDLDTRVSTQSSGTWRSN
ncbi:hypothetical protein [Priestia aryabhattai]|uniref:hypothetical protein n=1 Tax=Priestia aryabhattai TaxID=412384 RepID=UPI0030D374D9